MPLTFPNPVFPSDVAVEALDGTTHQRTGLVFVPKGAGPSSSPTLEVQVNRNLDRRHALVTESNALRAVDEVALLVGVYPGFYTLGGASKEFNGFTGQSLTDNAVNWVWIDASNALVVATSNFPVDLDTFVNTTDSLQAIRDTPPLGTAMRGTDSAAVQTACDASLVAIHLDPLLAVDTPTLPGVAGMTVLVTQTPTETGGVVTVTPS